jgi:LmbE family N-acetylglucosaminyl deacetylase
MNSKHSENVMFETTATLALLVAGIAMAALLYQLITVLVPMVESMVFPKMIAASPRAAGTGAATRTLAVLLAHADDETPVGPMLARYGREGVHVHLIIATDGSQGTGSVAGSLRPDSGLRGEEVVRARKAEARCAADALGAQPPILLGFPDGKLGDYIGDRSLLYRLTDRIAGELQQLHPNAVLTWGPDGGTGHPDHRLVSAIATQLVRAGAPGVPDRLFYMSFPVGAMRAMNPQRGEPPLLVPEAKYFTVRVPFTQRDFDRAQQAMTCHRTQFTEEQVKRLAPFAVQAWNGEIRLIPAFQTGTSTDVFGN